MARNDGTSRGIALDASWFGFDGPELVEVIGRELSGSGARVKWDPAGRMVFHLDPAARSVLRRTGLAITNDRLVRSNETIVARNRGLITSNRRWLDALHAARSVRPPGD